MKTFGLAGFERRFCTVVLLIFIFSTWGIRAQLVADGQTAVLNGVTTNIADNVTIGTNIGFTTLLLTNASAVSNSGSVAIGQASVSGHNRLMVAGASAWTNRGISFNIGSSGSFNELDVVGGSTVTSGIAYMGFTSASSNNTVLVSDAGSLWQPSNVYLGQGGGADNLLIVSNGAKVASFSGILGTGNGKSNTAIVTGTGSVWTNNNNLSVGAYGSNSLFIVTNGGAAFSGNFSGVGMQGSSSVGNLAVVTDPGSSWTSVGTFFIGGFSSGNQLMILNGGKLSTFASRIGDSAGLSNNLVLVDGLGSVWTNANGFLIGNLGARNTLIVTNGGRINDLTTGLVNVANSSSSSNNTVVITGTGSAFNCGVFNLGGTGPGGNQARIDKGATFLVSLGAFSVGVRCNSNLLTLADTNSLLQCNGFHMGHDATNNLCVVSNGATLAVVGNQGNLIDGTFTRMTITGGGTLCSIAGDLQFGGFSDVLAIMSGGALVDTNGFAANTVIVAGTNSLWKNFGDFQWVGTNGQLLITNGGMLLASNSYFGGDSNNTALVSGLGSLWTNRESLYLGNNGPNNTLTVTDLGAIQSGLIQVGDNGDGNQLVVGNSGTVTARGIAIGSSNSASNSITVTGGTITVMSDYILFLSSYGTLKLNSGLITAPSIMTDFAGPIGSKILLNGGTLQSGETYYANSAPFAVGDGTDAATFEMLSGNHYFSGGVNISSNGVLKGSGTLGTNITVNSGGTITPGSTNIGTIVALGNLTLNAGSTTLMKLNALSGTADNLSGMSNVFYGGTLQLTNLTGSLAAGNSFKLFSATNYFGAFDTVSPSTPGPGLKWNTNSLNVDGVLGVISTTTPPTLRTALAAGGNLVIDATGGNPYGVCYLLTCTNFPPTPADWTYVTTNYFDVLGATSFTNAIPANDSQRYFRIQVN
jgi:T5SS/PEP-CTERM-associated repeat protein